MAHDYGSNIDLPNAGVTDEDRLNSGPISDADQARLDQEALTQYDTDGSGDLGFWEGIRKGWDEWSIDPVGGIDDFLSGGQGGEGPGGLITFAAEFILGIDPKNKWARQIVESATRGELTAEFVEDFITQVDHNTQIRQTLNENINARGDLVSGGVTPNDAARIRRELATSQGTGGNSGTTHAAGVAHTRARKSEREALAALEDFRKNNDQGGVITLGADGKPNNTEAVHAYNEKIAELGKTYNEAKEVSSTTGDTWNEARSTDRDNLATLENWDNSAAGGFDALQRAGTDFAAETAEGLKDNTAAIMKELTDTRDRTVERLEKDAGEIRSLLKSRGEGERGRIDTQFDKASAAAQQDLTSRGLTGTTVLPGVRAGVEGRRSDAHGALSDRLLDDELRIERYLRENIANADATLSTNIADFMAGGGMESILAGHGVQTGALRFSSEQQMKIIALGLGQSDVEFADTLSQWDGEDLQAKFNAAMAANSQWGEYLAEAPEEPSDWETYGVAGGTALADFYTAGAFSASGGAGLVQGELAGQRSQGYTPPTFQGSATEHVPGGSGGFNYNQSTGDGGGAPDQFGF